MEKDEYHHSSKYYNITYFYDLNKLAEFVEKSDLQILRKKYDDHKKAKITKKEETDKNAKPYYAYVKYSEKGASKKAKRRYYESFAIIYKDFAYLSYDKKKRVNGSNFNIDKTFNERPEDMSEETETEILSKIFKKSK